MRVPLPLRAIAALCAAGIAASGAAAAPPAPRVTAVVSTDIAAWAVSGIPDLDQLRRLSVVRANLPNQGKMYCAPTSAANLLAVLHRTGHADGVVDGSRDWQDTAFYDDAVAALTTLGTMMRTDPTAGTQGDDMALALRRLLTDRAVASGTHVTRRTAFTDSYHDRLYTAPNAADLGEVGLNGGLAVVVRGTYSSQVDASGRTSWLRTSGHLMTAVAASGQHSTGSGEVTVHDPWSSSTLDTTQSAFLDEVRTLSAPMTFTRADDSGGSARWAVSASQWDSSTGRFLEGYVAIFPERLWVFRPGSRWLEGFAPEPILEGDEPLDRIELSGGGGGGGESSGGGGISDVALHPATGGPVVLTRQGRVIRLGAGTSKARQPHRTLATVPGATQLAVGSDGAVAVAGDGRLVVRAGARALQARLPEGAVRDLIVDPRTGTVHVLLGGRIHVFGARLKAVGSRRAPGGATHLMLTDTGVKATQGLRTARGALVRADSQGRVTIGKERITGLKAVRGARVGAVMNMPFLIDREYVKGPLDRLPPGVPDDGPGDPPPPRPNLSAGLNAQGQLTVKNSGPLPAPPSVVRLTLPGGAPQDLSVPALAPLEVHVLIRPACQGQFTAVADATGTVSESDEGDNTLVAACPT